MPFPKHESQTVEFKQIWKDDYLKTICAFANSDGGNLYIGVLDNGKFCGIEKHVKMLEILPSKINNRLGLLCDVLSISTDDTVIIEIKVPKTYSPISYHGKFYKRSGSSKLL